MSSLEDSKSNESQQLVVATDIFGKTHAVERLVTSIVSGASVCDDVRYDVTIIEPYTDKHEFQSESDAYEFFVKNVGIARYADILTSCLHDIARRQKDTSITAIGFSVGGSSLWRLSENQRVPKLRRAICFYPSQIRYDLSIRPMWPYHIIFPKQEFSFSVDDVSHKLLENEKVTIEKASADHGFMNERSQNFHAEMKSHYVNWICRQLFEQQHEI